jgi:exodeoxyribonuclease V gamma subunit
VIAFSGRDERSNLPRPPAVPLGELLDTIDATVRTEAGPARSRVVIRHPLQPFDERNFVSGTLTPDHPWSFDGAALAGARAARGVRSEPPPFLPDRLAPAEVRTVELEALTAFAGHPVRAFLRRRLQITLSDRQDELDDALPVQLDGLEEWSIGDRVLRARLAGMDPDDCMAAEIARGALPPGRLGFETYRGIAQRVSSLVHAAGPGDPESVRMHLELSGGRLVTGTVTGLVGRRLRKVSYSTLAAKHRLQSWVEFLALAATRADEPITALVVGRRKDDAATATLPAFPGPAGARRDAALAHLELIFDLYERALREPLPVYCKTSAAYARATREGKNAAWAAREEWESSWEWDREDREPEHLLALGDQVPFSALLEAPPRADEAGDGWPDWEASRFGRYALRLWTPLLDHEEGR